MTRGRRVGKLGAALLAVTTAGPPALAQEAAASAAEEPPRAAAEEPTPPAVREPTRPAAEEPTRSSAMRALEQALARRKLAAREPLSSERLRRELSTIEAKLDSGRRDEAIGDLVYLVESPRFDPFAKSAEGRAAIFLLGDALGRAGAYEAARGYLGRLLAGDPADVTYRRAVATLADLALSSGRPEDFVPLLDKVSPSAPADVQGDVSYVRGRVAELRGERDRALAAYSRVGESSRFWAQATYLAGVLEVERKNYKRGEELFCRVGHPRRTPRNAALFGGSDFFRVRDLARLGLGRIAHEQYRFDDARYYYYLVPRDSDYLPEALYETATTRYEAKDYDGAREALDELARLDREHPYSDEAWILDAYVDLASCRFPAADAKLKEFLKRYEPLRAAARKLAADDARLGRFVEAARTGGAPDEARRGSNEQAESSLRALLRADPGYVDASRRLSLLDHQLSGLRGAMRELDEARTRLANPSAAPAASKDPLDESPRRRLERAKVQLAEIERLLRDAARSGNQAARAALQKELEALKLRAAALERALAVPGAGAAGSDDELGRLIEQDRARATALHAEAERLRRALAAENVERAKDVLRRLDKRLTRLLNRARLGRIETVLGKKKALELEVEALSQGLLPHTIVDSLRTERYLRDDEEYWPFDGEDWADEYVGGEGLR
ncbi:MAG TPA: hypothetical protein VKY73_01040 [Polyangiaceae bacterium]|nr:hypothetical protein [Polyangiaceae bacterium]